MTIESWMPPHKKGDEAEAKKHTGATSNVLRGAQRAPFGKGEWGGAVAQEKVTVTYNEKTRERNLVTKYFKETGGPDGSTSALSAFKLLKEAGVKHIPVTYRQVGPTEILMTDYNRGDKVAVGGNKSEKEKGLRITSVSNLPELLSSIDQDIQRASAAEINIYTDCYFFIIPLSGGEVRVDFVIGDLGGIGKITTDEKTGLYSHNIERVEFALLSLGPLHAIEEEQARYERQIKEWASSLEKKGATPTPSPTPPWTVAYNLFMSEKQPEQPRRVLDIGGGPDLVEAGEGETKEYVRNYMQSLRVAELARKNPETEYYVLDPSLPISAAAELHTELPNVHFVAGKSDWKNFVPFADNSFDGVELNFVFTPLTMAELNSDTGLDEGEKMDKYMEWHNRDIISTEEIPLYVNTLREAARTLKLGGKLYLCEKKQRMDRIIRMLISDDSNKLDGKLLKEIGLKYVSTAEINDANRTKYASGAITMRDFHTSTGDEEKAEAYKVILVELEKTADALANAAMDRGA